MSTSTVDSKRRVVLPSVKPGDVFDVQQQDDGRFLLVRLERPAPPPGMTEEECLAAMREAPLRLSLEWEELRALTREP